MRIEGHWAVAGVFHAWLQKTPPSVVAQVSKPAVSSTSKSASCRDFGRVRRFGNLRHSRLGSLRYIVVCGMSGLALLSLLLAGCATRPLPDLPRSAADFPAEAFITQRAVLTARGRQFSLNGYLSLSRQRGKRLVVIGNFGGMLADLLIKPDGSRHIMRAARPLRPGWVKRFVADDLECVFGSAPAGHCPGQRISPTHFLIKRRWYSLDLQIVEIKPGPQPAEMFDETRKESP